MLAQCEDTIAIVTTKSIKLNAINHKSANCFGSNIDKLVWMLFVYRSSSQFKAQTNPETCTQLRDY